jgi:hypothetical protein
MIRTSPKTHTYTNVHTTHSQTGSDTRHDERDQVVEIAVSWGGELEGLQANVVQSLVVDTEGLVRVLNELMDGESGVVWLNNGVRDLK